MKKRSPSRHREQTVKTRNSRPTASFPPSQRSSESVESGASGMHQNVKPKLSHRMKRFLHLGLSLLCLMALIVAPVLCRSELAPTKLTCGSGMSSSSMPKSHHHTLPPCCAVHPSHQAPQLASIIELPAPASSSLLPALSFLPSTPFLIAVSQQHAPPPPALRPPLRI